MKSAKKLKIFIYGIEWYNGFETGMAKALQKRQIDVQFVCRSHLAKQHRYYLFDVLHKRIPKSATNFRQNLERDLAARIARFAPDMVLIFSGEHLSRTFLQSLKDRQRVPLLIWHVDDPFRWDYKVDALEIADHVIVYDRAILEQIKSKNPRVTYLPTCTDPERYRNQNYRLKYGDLSFIGHSYGGKGEIGLARAGVLSKAAAFDLVIYGDRDWANTYGHYPELSDKCIFKILSAEEAGYMYRKSKINLNINHPQNISSVTQRTFDIPAAGGFQLVQFSPSLPELFPLQDVVTFGSSDELVDKATYYLTRDAEREAIIKSNREHVLKHHTFDNRVNALLDIVGER